MTGPLLIERIEARILDIPTIRPHKLSFGAISRQSPVIVQLWLANGATGFGEAATIGGPSWNEESPESIQHAIEAYLAPALIGQDGCRIEAALARMDAWCKGNAFAKSAVEMALIDAVARSLGVPAWQLLGGKRHESLPLAWTLASGHIERDIEEAHLRLEQKRHRIFKMKIGARRPADDVAHVSEIARSLQGKATLTVDVNQAWSLTDARYGARGLQEIGCVLIEQPVARDKLAALKTLTDGYEIAIMADEVLQGPADAMRVAANRSADVFAVKVCQSGGLKPAADVIAIARAAGIDLYGGTMLESGLGTAAAIQLFATVPEWHFGTEMFGPLLLRDEILAEPLEYKDFSVTVPQGPGIGVSLDDDKVNFYRRDRTVSAKVVAGE